MEFTFRVIFLWFIAAFTIYITLGEHSPSAHARQACRCVPFLWFGKLMLGQNISLGLHGLLAAIIVPNLRTLRLHSGRFEKNGRPSKQTYGPKFGTVRSTRPTINIPMSSINCSKWYLVRRCLEQRPNLSWCFGEFKQLNTFSMDMWMSSLFFVGSTKHKRKGYRDTWSIYICIYTLRNSNLKFCNMFWLAGMEGLRLECFFFSEIINPRRPWARVLTGGWRKRIGTVLPIETCLIFTPTWGIIQFDLVFFSWVESWNHRL